MGGVSSDGLRNDPYFVDFVYFVTQSDVNMSYLETIKRLEEELSGGKKSERVPEEVEHSSNIKYGLEPIAGYEINELDERSPLHHQPLGSLKEQGELVLTMKDVPDLERRLRLSGWKVERVGDELRCWSGRKPRWRM